MTDKDFEVIQANFNTILLNQFDQPVTDKSIRLRLEDETIYDDEVSDNGNIDIGEISAQYLGMEIY